MSIWNIRSHYEVDISNDKAELYAKIVSVKLLVTVIIDFERYPSTYCLKQGRCFICSDLKFDHFTSHFYAWSFGFFIPAPTTSDLRLKRISIPDFIHYIFVLILEKEPVFPFWMFSAKQGNYWYHCYNVFGMTRSLTGDWTRDVPHSNPALYH